MAKETDARASEEKTGLFEQIVLEGFNKFSSTHSQNRKMKLMQYRHRSHFDGFWSQDERFQAELYRFMRKPIVFFRIRHPRDTELDENMKVIDTSYDFKNLHGRLIGDLGREFFPYAEEIYTRLIKEGVIQPYRGRIYWPASGPELVDSDSNLYTLAETEPFLRKTETQTLRF